jgi:hypothetical protein
MNKFRVTCLLEKGKNRHGGSDMRRVFATRKKFETREEAEKYAATVAEGRMPWVGYVQFETEYTHDHWTVYDPNEYDGPGGEIITLNGDLFDELQAVWDFCETFNRCTVMMYGVPCGGHPMSVDDEAGSGWKRCDKCGML